MNDEVVRLLTEIRELLRQANEDSERRAREAEENVERRMQEALARQDRSYELARGQMRRWKAVVLVLIPVLMIVGALLLCSLLAQH